MTPLRQIRSTAWDLLLLGVLLALASTPFLPVFGDYTGVGAAAFGIVAGLGAACVSGNRSWGPAPTTAFVFGVHLAGGTILLTPTLGLASAAQHAATGTVTVWKDFLTVSPPVSAYDGMMLLPWMLSLIASVSAGRLLIASRPTAAGVPSFALLACAILWGSSASRFAPLTGILLGVGTLVLWWRGTARRERTNLIGSAHEDVRASRSTRVRTVAALTGVLAVAALAALPVSMTPTAGRQVLRSAMTPPLNLAEYATPLSLMRHFETDLASTQLMHVDSPSEDLRLRIATMDSYDGRNALIGENSARARFELLGPRSRLLEGTAQSSVTVTIDDYAFPWIPAVVSTHSLDYRSPRGADIGQGLYYDPVSATLLLPAGTASGDVIAEAATVEGAASDAALSASSIGDPSDGTITNIPTTVSNLAAKIVGSESDPLRQIRALQQALRLSYYSDGTQSPSLPGHGAVRLSTMVRADDLIGDDEQYAVLMMLMCHSLKIPARVAMGFIPSTDGDARDVTGEDVHAWVEIPFTGIGWVPFDVTPDRDQIPQQQTTQKVSNPEPQVLQPPLPPPDSARLPPSYESEDDPRKDADDRASSVAWILALGGSLILLPPTLIVAAKALRRSTRRSLRTRAERARAAWDEIVDRALDFGHRTTPGATRREMAARLDEVFPGASLAPFGDAVDRCVFSDSEVSSYGDLWDSVDAILPSMSVGRPWWQRIRARVSLRSLLHPSGVRIRVHPRRKN